MVVVVVVVVVYLFRKDGWGVGVFTGDGGERRGGGLDEGEGEGVDDSIDNTLFVSTTQILR